MSDRVKESAQKIILHMHDYLIRNGAVYPLSPDDANDIIEYVRELESQYVYIDKFLEILTRMSAKQSEFLLELQETVLKIRQEMSIDRK